MLKHMLITKEGKKHACTSFEEQKIRVCARSAEEGHGGCS